MKKAIIISILVFLLAACSTDAQALVVKREEVPDTILIQKMKNSLSSEELTSIMTDEQKIDVLLNKVEGLQIEKKSSEQLLEEIKMQDYYILGFGEGETIEEMDTGKVPYYIIILENGRFLFPDTNSESTRLALITTKSHDQLVGEIKDLLGIDF